MTFHDPLAAAGIFNDDLPHVARGEVTVEPRQQPAPPGIHLLERGAGGRHEVAVDVDKEAFFAEYMSVFS